MNVAVIEHSCAVQQDFEYQDGDRGRSQDHHREELYKHGKDDFKGMKSEGRCHVEVPVRVMHDMHAPERGYCMEHNVLKVDYEIKGDNADNDLRSEGERINIQYAHPIRP